MSTSRSRCGQRGLVKEFDGQRAVDGVDLRVAAGEVRGVLGPNGAGKTTLLRLLFGLIAPDRGEIELFGRALRSDQPAALDGAAGFVEAPAFYPYLSARANLELLAQLDGADAAARIDQALERTGVARPRGRPRERLLDRDATAARHRGLAAALPAPVAARRALERSGSWPVSATSGRSSASSRMTASRVLLSSHQIVEVQGVCDSFTVLRKGARSGAGPPRSCASTRRRSSTG